jgi:hypothetical protein
MKYILTKVLNAIYFQLLCFFLAKLNVIMKKNRDFASDRVLMLKIL